MKNKRKIQLVTVFVSLYLSACQAGTTENLPNTNNKLTQAPTTAAPADSPNSNMQQNIALVGDYVSEGYDKRAEGYDWMAISVRQAGAQKLAISVRSRIDKKKPTCTLDAKLEPTDTSPYRYQLWLDNAPVYVDFDASGLSINGEVENLQKTAFYCSGGASLAGDYQRLTTALDSAQLDSSQYASTINYGDFFAHINSRANGDGSYALSITPMGETALTQTIDAPVIGADIGDLNADGHPEIVVFTQSVGSGSYGNVIAYSSNNGKSWSQAYLPDLPKEHATGYMGHDEFAIVENVLVRRFPIYLENDINAEPKGKMRQIQYRLINGEASRIFSVDKVYEF